MRRTKSNFHSITSLARPRSVSGTVTPGAFAAEVDEQLDF